MPGLSDKPGLAVIIAQKRSAEPKKGPDKEQMTSEMGSEILDGIKSGDAKKLGASLTNFVRYLMDSRD